MALYVSEMRDAIGQCRWEEWEGYGVVSKIIGAPISLIKPLSGASVQDEARGCPESARRVSELSD